MSAGAVLLLLARAEGGTLGLLVFSVSMLATGCLFLIPSVRYHATTHRLAEQRALPGPAPLLTLAIVVALTGCGALVILIGGVEPRMW